MTTGKYLLCILGLAVCAFFLVARNQPASDVKFPAGIAAPSKNLNIQPLASPYVTATARNLLQAPFATTTTGGSAAPMSLPITLEENAGQAGKRVAFLARGKRMTALLTQTGIEVFVGARAGGKGTCGVLKLRFVELRAGPAHLNRAAGEFVWRGDRRLRGESNYFLGNDPQLWRTHVAHFERAEARDIVPGVGVDVYGNEEGIEYDLRLAPGTDVGRLRLEVSGAHGIRLDSQGNLVMDVADRRILMRKPAIFVEHVTALVRDEENADGTPAARERVNGGYVLEADGSVGFRVSPHDSNATLVLDPSLSVSYATFLGGAGEDSANSLALDATGKVYVAGTTTSASTF